jgi:hypothetical protein
MFAFDDCFDDAGMVGSKIDYSRLFRMQIEKCEKNVIFTKDMGDSSFPYCFEECK